MQPKYWLKWEWCELTNITVYFAFLVNVAETGQSVVPLAMNVFS